MLEHDAVQHLMNICRLVCRKEARRWPGSEQLMEDCLQTVLTKVLAGIQRRSVIRAEFAPFAWKTAYYESRIFFIKNRANPVSLDACPEPLDPSVTNPLSELEEREEMERVQAALQKLSQKQREALDIVLGARHRDMAVTTLANRWGCDRKHVYYVRRLAVKAVRELLGLDKDGANHAN
jgi:RNA polymerase sigma factor (sigma-70 family)